jgi:hypothetical protein
MGLSRRLRGFTPERWFGLVRCSCSSFWFSCGPCRRHRAGRTVMIGDEVRSWRLAPPLRGWFLPGRT